jgi:adenylate cyclase
MLETSDHVSVQGLGVTANGQEPPAVYEAGQEVSVTVMFVDVRNFTRLSRERCPHQLVSSLNRFFGLVVPVVVEHGGYIDKFTGDGLMAVFGLPRQAVDHADRALAAARAIDALVGQSFDGWIDIGVGLDSGTVLLAIVGGGHRLEVTLIGHAVNMAAHVEAVTRQTGDTILLTDHTRALLTLEGIHLEPRSASVRGETNPVPLYTPARR